MIPNDTIIALATAQGMGAIAIIRLSGINAITIASKQFESTSGKQLSKQKSHTLHLGHIKESGNYIDQVLISIFKNPHSYTGEDVIEISCHGSIFIQQKILQLFLKNGCRMASAGEFTLRAFLNGKMDLSQAEAVADLIASDSAGAHQIALQQMRGGFSTKINDLRQQLLDFASLIELELDFAEEDVEFADRAQFNTLLLEITTTLKNLIDSFALGNVIKNGIPVAIVGEPNVGKSSLLNALLNEDRAIVSTIAGTTRDTIEDQLSIAGINFRFIDTAGLRETEDHVERIGISKAWEKISQASLVLYLFDATKNKEKEIQDLKVKYPDKNILCIANKIDEATKERLIQLKQQHIPPVLLSAKTGAGIEDLKQHLLKLSNTGHLGTNDVIITNNRHYDALLKALDAIQRVIAGMADELPTDLMAIDIRDALYHLGEITGSVSTEDLLGNIFANFCIGK